MIHLLFEQSGTFKNEFKKLGYEAIDYDIQNQFGETDVVIDLFKEIQTEYSGGASIFKKIKKEDTVFAFFPCTRFENQILLHFRGDAKQMKKWSLEKKLEYNMKLHDELNLFYGLISKLVIISKRIGFKLIIENPYSQQHYLTNYWCVKPKLIDKDRTENGDFFRKPTQYFFINCKPKDNFIFEPKIIREKKTIINTNYGAERSMISKEYASRFIRQYIVD